MLLLLGGVDLQFEEYRQRFHCSWNWQFIFWYDIK